MVSIKPAALKSEEAAHYLGLSRAILAQWRLRGDPQKLGPPFKKVSHCLVLYKVDDLDAWLEARVNGQVA